MIALGKALLGLLGIAALALAIGERADPPQPSALVAGTPSDFDGDSGD